MHIQITIFMFSFMQQIFLVLLFKFFKQKGNISNGLSKKTP